MAEQIKEFYRGTKKSCNTNQDIVVVNNDATTTALVKNIWIENPDRDNSFAVKVGNTVIYENTAIASGETVKLENENMVISKSGSLTVSNDKIRFINPIELSNIDNSDMNINIGDAFNCLYDDDNKKIWVFAGNANDNVALYRAVYNLDGTLAADWAAIDTHSDTGKLFTNAVILNNTYLLICYKQEDKKEKFKVLDRKTYSCENEHDVLTNNYNNYQNKGLAVIGDGQKVLFAAKRNSGDLDIAWLTEDDSVDSIEGHCTNASYVNISRLSDGNVAVVFEDGDGPALKVSVFDESTTPVVDKVEIYSSGTYNHSLLGLSNGTFIESWRKPSDDSAWAGIWNNDGTEAVAPWRVDLTRSYKTKMFELSNTNILIIHLINSNLSEPDKRWYFHEYTIDGVFVDSGEFAALSNQRYDTTDFCLVDDNIYKACEPVDKSEALYLHIGKSDLNVKVDGVEITE